MLFITYLFSAFVLLSYYHNVMNSSRVYVLPGKSWKMNIVDN